MVGQLQVCEYEHCGPCSCPVIVHGSHSADMGVKILSWNKDNESVNLVGFLAPLSLIPFLQYFN